MVTKMLFTDKAIAGLVSQSGYLTVQDTAEPHLRCRVAPTGKRAFFFYGRVDGKPVMENLEADTVAGARTEATDFPQVYRDREAAALQIAPLTIAEALAETLDHTRRKDRAKQDWEASSKPFLAWMQEHYPAVLNWQDITHPMFDKYLHHIRAKKGKGEAKTLTVPSENYKRLRMNPMVQTGLRMETVYGLPNRCRAFKLGNTPVESPCYVSVKHVLSLLEYTRAHASDLEAPIALAGLTGLAVMEIIRLKWDKVDLENGTVTVSGEVKNKYRTRTLPVCKRVLEALKRGHENELSDHVAAFGVGEHYDNDRWQIYGKRLNKVVKAWNRTLDKPIEPLFYGKDLRNCLPTLAVEKMTHGMVWEHYIGHCPQGVTEKHYVPKQKIEAFNKQVIPVIEQAVTEAQAELEAEKAEAPEQVEPAKEPKNPSGQNEADVMSFLSDGTPHKAEEIGE